MLKEITGKFEKYSLFKVPTNKYQFPIKKVLYFITSPTLLLDEKLFTEKINTNIIVKPQVFHSIQNKTTRVF